MLTYLLYFFLILFASSVIIVKNPIHSILYLVLCFIIISIMLIRLKVEFLALTYLMVYVGAIAVLFLFVIMMLDIEQRFGQSKRKTSLILINFYLSLIFSFELFLCIELLFNSYQETWVLLKQNYNIRVSGLEQFDELIDWFVIGEVFYLNYYYLFLMAGLLLLISMVGSIYLVLDSSDKAFRKYQIDYQQVLRKENMAVIFKKKNK